MTATMAVAERGRVLIVEDNVDLAFGLRRTLEAEGYAVDVAGDGPSGVARVREFLPDIDVMDLMLPGYDGFQALRTLRERGHQVPVLFLTARSEEADKVHGFRLGADDYVTKPFGLSELVARVGAVLRRSRTGRPAPAAAAFQFGDVEVNPAARTVTKGGRHVSLAPREFDLLLALVRQPGVVLSRHVLLKSVWEHQAEVVTRTVDIHVAELRRKLEDDHAHPRHLVTVWKAGYRFDP
jgi:DNA-binding response OmpR family regulator